MIDLTTLSDAELGLLSQRLTHEWTRRENLPAVSAAQAEVVADMRDRGTLPAPVSPVNPTGPGDFPAWADPGTDHGAMYLPGDRVEHGGTVWESAYPGLNHWQPGDEGVDYRIWRGVTDEVLSPEQSAGPPAWDGQGYAYSVGDLVTYQGGTYKVIQAHTSAGHWTPDVVASLYTRQ